MADPRRDEPPRRGDRGAYAHYLAGMDASMRQKVALTAAHLLCEGRVADMGMGSGTGSHALAALYPALDVVGVDLDPTMVELATARHSLPNLGFVVGDIAEPVFAPGSLDGIFDSSVLHHVTTFTGYDHEAAARALAVQVAQLAPHGVLIVRDFVDPGPGRVLLDLPADDGDDGDDPTTCSTARLLELFAAQFRPLSDAPGFPLERVAELPDGWVRFELAHKHAVELVLRKDYRESWGPEVKEEYTYFTQDRFEAVFAELGLRVLASTPIRNPWILRNRFHGRFVIRDLDGAPLEWPATNYVIVGERVPEGEGVRLSSSGPHAPLGFLAMEHHRDRRTGRVMDLVRRPNPTVDVIPWFEDDGDVFVLARASYPRPILSCAGGEAAVDGSRAVTYVTEPLSAIQRDAPVGTTAEEALERRAGIPPSAIRGFRGGGTYYPSPGGILEEVRSVLVEVDRVLVAATPPTHDTGFRSRGRVRAIEACQLLRSAQVGGLPDARLELNVYDLLLGLGREVGPWIGDAIELPDGPAPPVTTLDALLGRPPRRVFERAEPSASDGFLELRCEEFTEHDASGAPLAARALEYVVPRPLGSSTIAVAALLRHGDDVYLGVDDDDRPASQCFDGNSQLLVAPAWRLPRDVGTTTPARAWALERLRVDYDLDTGEVWELGGRYHPTPGLTPEVVHPIAVQVTRIGAAARSLCWVPLSDLVRQRARLHDGHLRVVTLRAAHALGLSI